MIVIENRQEIKATKKIPIIANIGEIGIAVTASENMNCKSGTMIGVFSKGHIVVDEDNAISTTNMVSNNVYNDALNRILNNRN